MDSILKKLLIILAIASIALIPSQVYAERIISIEKTLPTERDKLIQVISDLEIYPQVLPKKIKSSNILNEDLNIAKMTFKFEFLSVDADVKYHSPSPDKVILEVVSGDLKGTTLSGVLTDIEGSQSSATDVKAVLDLKISWYLSLATTFISDSNIESMLHTSLEQFSDYANNPQPAPIVQEPEKTCFLVWCW
jgi:ribosome-associated toxin RatA of RatAB toxin-antitoxin module